MLSGHATSITRKLTWMNMLVSAAALILASAGFTAYDLQSFRQSMVQHLSIQAQIVGSNCVSALLFNDARSAESTLAALKAAPHIVNAEVYTRNGRPFAGYGWGGKGVAISLPLVLRHKIEAHRFGGSHLVLVR
ncbi:MAG: CHASE sensor domain-containing protein, partial [Terriglobia bacterium]